VLHVRHGHLDLRTCSRYDPILSAKFLAGVVISDARVRTYADIGKKAFGVRSMPLVNFMFCFETFSVG
jgi:vesicular inhibitory amino acid transporter